MGKRFKKRDASRGRDFDNIFPVDPEPSQDALITRTGRLFRLFGAEEDMFCRMMEVINNLRQFIAKEKTIIIDCPHKDNKTRCPYLKNKPLKLRLGQRPVITEAMVARAMGLSDRKFRYLKKKLLKHIAEARAQR